jgi:hypothetical protein
VFQTADGPRGARTLAKKPRLPLRTAVGRAIASPSYRYMNKPASKYTVLGEAMRAHYAIQHGIATAEEYERRGDDPCPDCGEPEHATHTLNRCLKGWFSTKEGEQYKGADAAREYVRKFLQNVEGGEKMLTVGEADECGYCDVMPTSSRSRSHECEAGVHADATRMGAEAQLLRRSGRTVTSGEYSEWMCDTSSARGADARWPCAIWHLAVVRVVWAGVWHTQGRMTDVGCSCVM